MSATLQTFATDINCGSCVRSVTPFLDELDGVTIWRVDVEDERKLLTVEGIATREDIMRVVRDAGYAIRPIEVAA
jgi:copper chaperone CopZ